MKALKLLIFSLVFAVTAAYATQPRKVLVIGIDGTRADALQQANTPNIDGLLPNALYTFNTWHAGITVSGPSWSDIMTGVWEDKHGITNNNYTGGNFAQFPYFTTRAKEIKPNLYCAEVIEWAPLINGVTNDSWDKKILVPDGGGIATADSAVAMLANPNLDAMFVYFDAVDLAGHASGFDPANSTYISAIEGVDGHIGTILTALYNRPTYAQEDWLILLVTDHGGIGTIHGGCSDTERNIWWIASGSAVNHQELTGGDAGTTYSLYQLLCSVPDLDLTQFPATPLHPDIAVTALHHLIYDSGINPEDKTEWALDGKSWLKTPTGISALNTSTNVVAYPNPSADMVTLWFENKGNEKVSYAVYDVQGKSVEASTVLASTNKLTLNLCNNADGVYVIKLSVGKNTLTKRVLLSSGAPHGVANHAGCDKHQ